MATIDRIETRCPACGNTTLFIGDGGYLTCSWVKCRNPGAIHDAAALHQANQEYARAKVAFDRGRLDEDRHEWTHRWRRLIAAEQRLIELAELPLAAPTGGA